MKTLGSVVYRANLKDPAKSQPAFEFKKAREVGLREDWFRDLVFAHPEVLMGPIRAGTLIGDEQWYPWAIEAPTDVGPIDVLLVSDSGRVGVVETKLSYNPERRRQVVAQLLDYAINLTGMLVDDLPDLPEDGPHSSDVQNHLDDGDHLLVIAGDELDTRAIRLGQATIGDHLVNPWDLALVDLAVYQQAGGEDSLVIPTLRGQVVSETRQVVKIEIEGTKKRIQVERVEASVPKSSGRFRWTEKLFLEELRTCELKEEFKSFARDLIDMVHGDASLNLSWGTGTRKGSFTVKRRGYGLVEVYLNARIAFRIDKIQKALSEKGATAYIDALDSLLPGFGDSEYPYIGREELEGRAGQVARILRETLASET